MWLGSHGNPNEIDTMGVDLCQVLSPCLDGCWGSEVAFID